MTEISKHGPWTLSPGRDWSPLVERLSDKLKGQTVIVTTTDTFDAETATTHWVRLGQDLKVTLSASGIHLPINLGIYVPTDRKERQPVIDMLGDHIQIHTPKKMLPSSWADMTRHYVNYSITTTGYWYQ